MNWQPIETCPKVVGEVYLVTNGEVLCHAEWLQVPNMEHPPEWDLWAGTLFAESRKLDWIGYEGVHPFKPTHWSEKLSPPGAS